jgi:hypothetical protein
MNAHAQSCEAAHARARYRVYWLGGEGRIDGAEIIQAVDDREASATARGMIDGRCVELWDGGRFIGRFDPANLAIAEQP